MKQLFLDHSNLVPSSPAVSGLNFLLLQGFGELELWIRRLADRDLASSFLFVFK
jgi:hypothetical protein